MLRSEEYDRILNVKTPNEVIEVLRATIYKRCLQEISQKNIIVDFEKKLMDDFYLIFSQILTLTPLRCKEFLKVVFRKYELFTLKTIFRILAKGLPVDEALTYIIPVGKYDIDKCKVILTAKTVQHAIGTIEEPELREALIPLVRVYEQTQQTLPLEAVIDKYIFTRIWEESKKLKGSDRNFVRHFTGHEINLMNILFLLRAKKNGLDEAVIKKLLLPIYFNLPSTYFENALRSPTAMAALRLLTTGYYEKLLSPLLIQCETKKSFLPLEVGFKRYLAHEYLKSFEGLRFHAGLIISLLNLKKFELEDLKVIIIGKANGLSAEYIKDMLVLHQPTI
jgi:V/A-type H+-transporting ATPase subunit C